MEVNEISNGLFLRLRNDGNYLLNLKNFSGDYLKIKDAINYYKIKVITISGKIDCNCFKFLENIESINIFNNDSFEPSGLYELKSLKALEIEYTHQSKFHFQSNTLLMELEIEWNKYLNIQDLDYLEKLTIRKYKQREFSIKTPSKVKHLEIIQGNMKSLNGIEKQLNLNSLTLCYLPKLEDFSQISKLETLEYLEFMNCKKLDNLNFIKNLKNLKWIRIGNCQEIETLNPLMELNELKGISIWGKTKILDNNEKILIQKNKTKITAPYEKISQRIFKENSSQH